MSRARDIAGLAASALILLSSAAHSLLGWKALSSELLGISGDPFFSVFIVPGALLAIASLFRS